MIPTIMTQIIGTAVVAPPELAIGAEVAMGHRLGDAEDGGGGAGDVRSLGGG